MLDFFNYLRKEEPKAVAAIVALLGGTVGTLYALWVVTG